MQGLITKDVVRVDIILKDKSEVSITPQEFEMYQKAYPDIDIERELAKMAAWCWSNPSKRKTKKGFKSFVNGWLGRAKPEPQGQRTRDLTFEQQLNNRDWAK